MCMVMVQVLDGQIKGIVSGIKNVPVNLNVMRDFILILFLLQKTQ